MDFNILELSEVGLMINPYAAVTEDGEWISGFISIDFLISNFGDLSKAEIFKKAKISEGLTLYFEWLDGKGLLT